MRMRLTPARRAALTLTLTAVAAGPAAGALGQNAGPEKPPLPDFTVMYAKSAKSKQQVTAKLGSYCLPSADGTGTCKDVPNPLPNLPKLKVTKGEELTLLFKQPVGYITFRTARVNKTTGQEILIKGGEGSAVTKTKKRWRITLPKNLTKSATIVGVFAQYLNAYSSFEFGITVR